MPLPARRPFAKPAKPPTDLLIHLRERGLIIGDEPKALRQLQVIGYYRLLIYMRPLQLLPGKLFRAGARFDDIVALYDFDRRLRLICLDAIERVEVALRAAINNELAVPLGPHFYLDPRNFEKVDGFKKFQRLACSADYLAITHYYDHYHAPSLPPIWAVTEAITFGAISRLFADLTLANRKLVARAFGYDEEILVSWFRSISDLRNRCAHHNRTWNANMAPCQPKVARRVAAQFGSRQDCFYARAVVLAALLDAIGQGAVWRRDLAWHVRGAQPLISAATMGFPPGWEAMPFWVLPPDRRGATLT
jgi:abortive infection bacteriophage resistance protein